MEQSGISGYVGLSLLKIANYAALKVSLLSSMPRLVPLCSSHNLRILHVLAYLLHCECAIKSNHYSIDPFSKLKAYLLH